MKTALVVACCALAWAGSAGAANVNHGKHLFGEYCAACHGMTSELGFGPGRAQEVQKANAPSLLGVGAMAAHLYLTTGYMPLKRVGTQPRRSRLILSQGEIDDLIAYVASLGKGPAIPTPHPQRGNLPEGMHLFTNHCAGCHQIVAQGGYVTGGLPPPLQDATDVQIAEAVRIGPWVMPRFSEQAISNRQLDSIIRYVDFTKHPDNRGGWAIGNLGPVPEGLVAWFIGMGLLIVVCVLIGTRLRA
jgi:ubiquinol-cytochrome c reductase cytochrome c subunit